MLLVIHARDGAIVRMCAICITIALRVVVHLHWICTEISETESYNDYKTYYNKTIVWCNLCVNLAKEPYKCQIFLWVFFIKRCWQACYIFPFRFCSKLYMKTKTNGKVRKSWRIFRTVGHGGFSIVRAGDRVFSTMLYSFVIQEKPGVERLTW